VESESGRPRVFKTRWFQRFARKEKISDAVLFNAVARAGKGQVDADLGGGVIKQRIARAGRGKSGGYRAIIFFRRSELAVFAYGFAKSERENIDSNEEKQFKEAARHVLRLTEKQIAELVKNGDFVELTGDEQEISK
jgi:hypothetical protein